MKKGRRVVITGMGAVTAVGNNVKEFWKNILEGKNGIDYITKFNPEFSKVKIAAEVKNFNYDSYSIDAIRKNRVDLFSQYSLVASKEALKEANFNWQSNDSDPFRRGVLIGSGIGGLTVIQSAAQDGRHLGHNTVKMQPLFIPKVISNMGAANVSIAFNFKGHVVSPISACSSGSHAIGDAYRLIKDDYLDVAIAGGTESSVIDFGICSFSALTALNSSNDINRSSIPFDKERKGFVMGEGAGVLMMEDLESAQRRNATILGEIVGYESFSDAHHITAPTGEGIIHAMNSLFLNYNLQKHEVGHINAHGTSTILNDKTETEAIKSTFNEHAYKISISGIKSMIGHCLGAAGGIEAIATVLALRDQVAPPTINYRVKDPELDLDYTTNEKKALNTKYAISNSLAFGGHSVSLLFKKWD